MWSLISGIGSAALAALAIDGSIGMQPFLVFSSVLSGLGSININILETKKGN